jgi:hypothetical protein
MERIEGQARVHSKRLNEVLVASIKTFTHVSDKRNI